MKRLLVVNNIPTPYRTAMFNRMHELGRERGIELLVAFQARREARRQWRAEDFDMRFPHFVSTGLSLRKGAGEVDLFRYATLDRDILHRIATGRFDWVMMSPLMSLTGWVASLVPAARSTRLLWSESNLRSARRTGPLARALKRALVGRYQVLVCPGQRAVDYVCSLAPSLHARPVLWLRNVVDTALFRERTAALRRERQAIRRELGVTERTRLVACVGQLVESKGHRAVLEAAARVQGDLRIAVAGDGPLRAELVRRARELGVADRVALLGQLPADRVTRLLAAADWFLHPALADPSPLVAVEALNAGLPLAVSAQTGNAPEVVDEGGNGFRFDAEDPEEVMRALQRMLTTSGAALHGMREASLRIAHTRFDPDVVLGGFLDDLLALRAA